MHDEAAPRSWLRRDLPPAVAALRRLTRLTAIKISAGTEGNPGFDDQEPQDLVPLPPLAGLAALTELSLQHLALPPPDLCRLSGLRRLELTEHVDWSDQPLTGLASLTHLGGYTHSLPKPQHMTALPRLASVRAPEAGDAWRQQLAALLPHVAFSAAYW